MTSSTVAEGAKADSEVKTVNPTKPDQVDARAAVEVGDAAHGHQHGARWRARTTVEIQPSITADRWNSDSISGSAMLIDGRHERGHEPGHRR